MARVRVSLYLGRPERKLGTGKVRLLEAIRAEGSISAAARSMGMAYRHAWEMVDDMNRCFREPVVETSSGGTAGGGATLTPWALELIERFHAIEQATERAIAAEVAVLEGRLRGSRRR